MAAIVIDRPSNGARALAGELGVRRVQPHRVAALAHRTLINWGVGTDYPRRTGQRVFNLPTAVRNAVDKVAALNAVERHAPPHWVDKAQVQREPNGIILARKNFLSEGRGIVVVRHGEELPDADFYTKYIRKKAEYRLHVAFGKVIAVQMKLRRTGQEPTKDELLIRNHANGWIFAVNDVEYPSPEAKQQLHDAAVNCLARLGLHFAALDFIVDKRNDTPYFLEANTRPGIESPTILAAYTAAFNEAIAHR